jgi:hypothetical protein
MDGGQALRAIMRHAHAADSSGFGFDRSDSFVGKWRPSAGSGG